MNERVSTCVLMVRGMFQSPLPVYFETAKVHPFSLLLQTPPTLFLFFFTLSRPPYCNTSCTRSKISSNCNGSASPRRARAKERSVRAKLTQLAVMVVPTLESESLFRPFFSEHKSGLRKLSTIFQVSHLDHALCSLFACIAVGFAGVACAQKVQRRVVNPCNHVM